MNNQLIKQARYNAVLGLEDVAQALGVSKSYVYRVEVNERWYTPEMLRKFYELTKDFNKFSYEKLAKYEIKVRLESSKKKLEKEYLGE